MQDSVNTSPDKKLTPDFFYEAYRKSMQEKKPIKSKLDGLYDTYSTNYTSEEYWTKRILAAIGFRQTKLSIFWQGEEMSDSETTVDDYRKLFNMDYNGKPSLKSLVMDTLSQEFKIVAEERFTMTSGDYGNEYEVSIDWTPLEERSDVKRKRAEEDI